MSVVLRGAASALHEAVDREVSRQRHAGRHSSPRARCIQSAELSPRKGRRGRHDALSLLSQRPEGPDHSIGVFLWTRDAQRAFWRSQGVRRRAHAAQLWENLRSQSRRVVHSSLYGSLPPWSLPSLLGDHCFALPMRKNEADRALWSGSCGGALRSDLREAFGLQRTHVYAGMSRRTVSVVHGERGVSMLLREAPHDDALRKDQNGDLLVQSGLSSRADDRYEGHRDGGNRLCRSV